MTNRIALFLFAAVALPAAAQWDGATRQALEAENARRAAAAPTVSADTVSSGRTAGESISAPVPSDYPADMPKPGSAPAYEENLADKQAAEARKARVEQNRPVVVGGYGSRRGNTYVVNGSGFGAAAAGAAMVGTDVLLNSGRPGNAVGNSSNMTIPAN